MIITAFTTVTDRGSVALLKENLLVDERQLNGALKHARDLIPTIDELLNSNGLSFNDVDLLCVDVGPGSYTGMRVGIATAKGLQFASGKPVAGVCSLEAMAYSASRACTGTIVPVIDAKWKQLYFGIFRSAGGKHTIEKKCDVATADEIVRRIPKDSIICGNIDSPYKHLFRRFTFLPSEFHYPCARDIGTLGIHKFRKSCAEPLEPIYLRPSEAEKNKFVQ